MLSASLASARPPLPYWFRRSSRTWLRCLRLLRWHETNVRHAAVRFAESSRLQKKSTKLYRLAYRTARVRSRLVQTHTTGEQFTHVVLCKTSVCHSSPIVHTHNARFHYACASSYAKSAGHARKSAVTCIPFISECARTALHYFNVVKKSDYSLYWTLNERVRTKLILRKQARAHTRALHTLHSRSRAWETSVLTDVPTPPRPPIRSKFASFHFPVSLL